MSRAKPRRIPLHYEWTLFQDVHISSAGLTANREGETRNRRRAHGRKYHRDGSSREIARRAFRDRTKASRVFLRAHRGFNLALVNIKYNNQTNRRKKYDIVSYLWRPNAYRPEIWRKKNKTTTTLSVAVWLQWAFISNKHMYIEYMYGCMVLSWQSRIIFMLQ